jgi:acetoin utilization protein AcuB
MTLATYARMENTQRVADIMERDVIVLSVADKLENIAEGMRTYGLRQLPVVEGRRFVGMLHERALLRHSLDSRDPSPLVRAGSKPRWRTTRVSDLMSAHTPVLSVDASVSHAARLLARSLSDAIPVVSKDGELVGIVTRRALVSLLGRVLSEPHTPHPHAA